MFMIVIHNRSIHDFIKKGYHHHDYHVHWHLHPEDVSHHPSHAKHSDAQAGERGVHQEQALNLDDDGDHHDHDHDDNGEYDAHGIKRRPLT